MKIIGFKQFIIFWASQSVSQLGSSMTTFAMTIWIYKETKSAMAVSMLMFCTYLPMVIASVFAGAFIDKHDKKKIMLSCDTIAAICTCILWGLMSRNILELWHVYLINIAIGFMNAFQTPASTIIIGLIVPENLYSKASGMNSFSSSLITIVMPMFTTFLISFWGLSMVILFDLATFLLAVFILLFLIRLPKNGKNMERNSSLKAEIKVGFSFLRTHKGILYLILSIAILNFFSNITYENILSPMILARSGDNDMVLGVVSGVLGIGGLIGGIIVSIKEISGNRIKIIYFCAAISFLFGDFFMGLGNNVFIWSIAGLAASIPIPFITAQQNVILYQYIPQNIQGRVFAVRNALQYCTIPLGILLGGILADYVFEPLMQNGFLTFLSKILGNSEGSGMALMFIFTSILGFISCILGNHCVIAGNAHFTGFAAGLGVGFTTDLLLLRKRALIC